MQHDGTTRSSCQLGGRPTADVELACSICSALLSGASSSSELDAAGCLSLGRPCPHKAQPTQQVHLSCRRPQSQALDLSACLHYFFSEFYEEIHAEHCKHLKRCKVVRCCVAENLNLLRGVSYLEIPVIQLMSWKSAAENPRLLKRVLPT